MQPVQTFIIMELRDDTIYIIYVCMVLVITHLVLNIKGEQQAAGNTDGETGDIDKRKTLVLDEVAQGHGNVIF